MKNGCPSVAPVKFRWPTGASGTSRYCVFLATRRVAVDGFVCVYQNTHLIIPRIAVGAESGYAALAYSALNSHLDP